MNYTSHITHHTSHVTRHTPHVTRYTSHVTRNTSQEMHRLDKFRVNGKFQLLMAVEGRVQVMRPHTCVTLFNA